MIWKNPELELNPEHPFESDALEREQHAIRLTRLVQSTDVPFVLGITAPWGTGKTTFLRMWRHHLKAEGHPTLLFDAWKTDFVDDPLLAMVAELDDEIKATGLVGPDPSGRMATILERVRNAGAGALRLAAPIAIKAATAGLLDATHLNPAVERAADELSTALSGIAERRLAAYRQERASMDSFAEDLRALARAASESETPVANSTLPIVFMVDELDRCRPNYAVAILERIKHLFAVPGFVFVLGMDSAQLAASVRALYGQDFEARGYLRRFIDLEFQLPYPDSRRAVRYLFERASMVDALRPRPEAYDSEEAMREVLTGMATRFSLPFRTLEQCTSQLNLISRLTDPRHALHPTFLTFLVSFKAVNPVLYREYSSGKEGARTVVDFIGRPGPDEPIIPGQVGFACESYLYNYSKVHGERAERITELEQEVARLRAEAGELPRILDSAAVNVLDLMKSRPAGRDRLDALNTRIDLAEQFVGT